MISTVSHRFGKWEGEGKRKKRGDTNTSHHHTDKHHITHTFVHEGGGGATNRVQRQSGGCFRDGTKTGFLFQKVQKMVEVRQIAFSKIMS